MGVFAFFISNSMDKVFLTQFRSWLYQLSVSRVLLVGDKYERCVACDLLGLADQKSASKMYVLDANLDVKFRAFSTIYSQVWYTNLQYWSPNHLQQLSS